MPWLTLILGMAAACYGLYMLNIRMHRPQSLTKLVKMKEVYGDFQGNLIHLVFYTLFPLAVGLLLFIQWITGIASL